MFGTTPLRRIPVSSPTPGVTARVAAALLLAASATKAFPALPPVSPFDITGLLQAATLDTSGPLAGGTLTVNGQVIVVPKNLLVQLPAAFMTMPELFRLAPAPYGPTQTGLALTDSPPPLAAYQVLVQGNRVGDQYIAGLVTISQALVASGQGFINYVDYGRGEVRVGGTLGSPTTGQRVKLNDPIGRFSSTWSPDVRFTIDEDNPTVRSTTGFPMCIPRVDPSVVEDIECPQSNRPIDPNTGAYLSNFYMPDPALFTVPNALKQAPFELGDFVTYAGILVKDGPQATAGPPTTSTALVAAYSMIADVAILTWPGTDPAYIAIDVAILGAGGTPIAGIPQEATARTRFEGFSTDPTRLIFLFGVDADPCTDDRYERDWGIVASDPGPPVGAVLGRWRFRPPGKVLAMPSTGAFLPATRTVRAWLSSYPMNVANGLTSGTYEAPIAEYLFPENLAAGSQPVPHNFQEFPFLANGAGPWNGVGSNPVYAGIVGQLSPWPGQPTPTAPTCAPSTLQLPVAQAGPGQVVVSGAHVTLDGSGSRDPNGLAMTYAWTQTSGTKVTLSSATAVRPTFTAPTVSGNQGLVFQLVVKDSAGSSVPSSVAIAVQATAAPILPPIANAGPAQTVASGATVQLNASASRDPNVPALSLSYSWSQIAGPAVALNGATTTLPTFVAPAAPPGAPAVLSFWLVVQSAAGLGATSQVNVTVNPVLPPIANAGVDQLVLSNSNVTLSGLGSSDPNGLPLTYQWTQLTGPAVALSTAPNNPLATFKAPLFGPLVFALVVNDGFLSSTAAQVTVNVRNGADIVTIISAVYRISQQRLDVTASSNAGIQALLWLKGINGGADVALTPVNGVPTASIVGVPNPGTVTVFSNLGGSATRALTRVQN